MKSVAQTRTAGRRLRETRKSWNDKRNCIRPGRGRQVESVGEILGRVFRAIELRRDLQIVKTKLSAVQGDPSRSRLAGLLTGLAEQLKKELRA